MNLHALINLIKTVVQLFQGVFGKKGDGVKSSNHKHAIILLCQIIKQPASQHRGAIGTILGGATLKGEDFHQEPFQELVE